MLTRGEDVEAHALRKRGWSYSAIARHLGGDRRTVEAYLNEGREPGRRRRSTADSLERFVPYLPERFTEDPHVWASALFDEVVALGYERSYRMLCARSVSGRCARIARRVGGSRVGTGRYRPRTGRGVALWLSALQLLWAPGNMRRRGRRQAAFVAGHGGAIV